MDVEDGTSLDIGVVLGRHYRVNGTLSEGAIFIPLAMVQLAVTSSIEGYDVASGFRKTKSYWQSICP